jgi:hypothetical protein
MTTMPPKFWASDSESDDEVDKHIRVEMAPDDNAAGIISTPEFVAAAAAAVGFSKDDLHQAEQELGAGSSVSPSKPVQLKKKNQLWHIGLFLRW